MKYCTNCKINRQSWAEYKKDYEESDNKCWNCDNYTLISTSDLVRRSEPSFNKLVVSAYEKLSREVTVGTEDGNLRAGGSRKEQLTIDKETGDYHYEYYIEHAAKK